MSNKCRMWWVAEVHSSTDDLMVTQDVMQRLAVDLEAKKFIELLLISLISLGILAHVRRTYCNGSSMTIDHKLEYKARKLSTEFHEWMKDPQNHFGIKNVDYIDKVRASKCKEAKYLSPKIVLLSSLSVFMYIRRWHLASLGAVGKRAASHQHTFEAEHHEITHHSTFGSTLLSFCLKNRYKFLSHYY